MVKDIQIKYKNEQKEWEELYPKTKTRNITDDKGESQEEINENLTAQLAQTTSKTTYKSKNLMDYSSDLLTAFNQAMEDTENMVFHLDEGLFTTTNSLIFSRGKKLLLNPNTTIRTTKSDVPVFIMNRESELHGGNIRVNNMEVPYTSTCVLFDGNNFDCETGLLKDTKIYGSYGVNSKAIGLTANRTDPDAFTYSMYNQIENVYIQSFHYGIYLSAVNDDGGFVNGNVLSGRIFGCSHLIYVEGVSEGNNFNFMMQAGIQVGTETEFYGVYCDAKYNVFNGFIWDIGTGLTNIHCNFTTNSVGNILQTRPYNLDGAYIQDRMIDNGDRNTIGNLQPYQNVFFPPMSAGDGGQSGTAMLGQQDDSFAFLDSNPEYTLTKEFVGMTEVNNPPYRPYNLFKPEGEYLLLVDEKEQGHAKYTIEFSERKFYSIGLGFYNGASCDVTIKLYHNDILIREKTIPRTTEKRVSEFKTIANWNLTWEASPLGLNAEKLKTINKMEIILDNSKGNQLYIHNLYASSSEGGHTYLTRNGGNMYDNVTFSKNKSIVLTTPNGLNKYQIGIDDNGELTTTLIP